ncbi:hypothetical protein QR680_002179 [Steinernema hermaphroditum]|uniref:Uncharacterized protein n=1 Tax=Steinernema hermaphroditum TaxID=289476 RepID=A0AA39LHM7_9BILA|nr:hypothetical protein QR680_002179 [Steinernema hermaphroditum]
MFGFVLLLYVVTDGLCCAPSTPSPPPVYQPQIRLSSFMSTSVTTRNSVSMSHRLASLSHAPRNPILHDEAFRPAQPRQRIATFFRPPIRKNDGLSHNLINSPVFHFTFSPPVSWTYCEPACGTGDQSIDQESALDNAVIDVKDAINSALSDLGFAPIGEHNLRFDYTPFNMLLRDFNPEFFDHNGFQYRTVGKTVRLETRRNSPDHHTVAHNATVRVVDSYTFSVAFWEKVGILFRKHLFPKGVEVNHGPSLVRSTVEQTTFNRILTFHAAPIRSGIAVAPPRAQVVITEVPDVEHEMGDEGSGADAELLLSAVEGDRSVNSTKISENATLCNDC